MWITPQTAAGFAVAAAAASDRGSERALPGLSVAARAVARRAESLAALAPAEREAELAECIREGWFRKRHVSPAPISENQDPVTSRALTLIADQLPRELGRATLQAGPLPRPGFVPAPELLQLLGEIWNGVQSWHD